MRALTFESLELETSLSVCGHAFRIIRLNSYIKVIGSRSRSQKQKSVYVWAGTFECIDIIHFVLFGRYVFRTSMI